MSEYKKLEPNADSHKRKEYWDIAKGLQQTDGLTTSAYLETVIIKYLRSLGAEVNNAPFKQNARWFRDALVRANYTNMLENISADTNFLTMFFENILMNAGHGLSKIDLRVASK